MIYDYNTLVVTEGYRLVYFYPDENYYIGTYCKTLEGFMIGFAECDPIIDEDDIPKFESISDILHRCLINIKNITAVAIYDVNGNLVAKKERTKNNIK